MPFVPPFATALAAPPEPAAWRWMLGAEVNADSHGAADVAWSRGPWSVALLTDTLDARWTGEGDRGKAWVALRAEGGAAGLMITPWTDGAPDPSRAWTASYVGPEAGAIVYGPAGLYGGAQVSARVWGFGARDGTTIEPPPVQPRIVPEVVVGWWRTWGSAYGRAGATVAPAAAARLQPHAALQAGLHPDEARVVPRLEIRAGWAEDQDDISRARLGGLNPYVIPLAGATWAEFWVERYAAGRAGLGVRGGPATVSGVLDAATWTGAAPSDTRGATAGFGLLTDLELESGTKAALHLGYAPWLPRRERWGGLAAWAYVQQTLGAR